MIDLFKRRQHSAAGVVDMNLLPADQRPGDLAPIAALVAAGLIVSLIVIVPMSFRFANAKSSADASVEQAQEAEQRIHGVQVDLAKHRALQSQLDQTQAQLAALRTERELLQGGSRPLSDDLGTVLRADLLPGGMRLTAVSTGTTGLHVEGTAANPLDAIAYADHLVRTGGFASARMISFAPGATAGQFIVEVTR